jgi:hypothetical protein
MKTPKAIKREELAVRWKSERWTPVIVYQAGETHLNGHATRPRFQFKPKRRANRSAEPVLVVKWGRIQARQ